MRTWYGFCHLISITITVYECHNLQVHNYSIFFISEVQNTILPSFGQDGVLYYSLLGYFISEKDAILCKSFINCCSAFKSSSPVREGSND